ncbi:protein TRANSPARENT TESTA 12 [Cucumis melo var. makuwa]|uniref:Protein DETOXIFICATION n=1 Tax=Cucumis melo var. makuwa TaxID=1194695 RepID=A0A5A7TFQ8_CUCMM|nr:protein TRANSPARENT TESTA 12 [Cucumis melo var. makuwa]
MEGNDILEPLVEKAAAKHEAVSGELENILSDTELGYVVRIRRAAWIELKLLSKLAAPAVFVYMINNFMSMSTRIFSGHLGNLQLAAASLGNNGVQIFAYGESPEIASSAAIFVYGLIPQIFAYAINFPIQKFLQSQSVVLPSAYISAATLVVHLSLSWVAAYKLGLGLFGASSVLSLSWWIIVTAQFVYILKSERFKLTWRGFSSAAFSGLPEFFKLSAASAIMLCLETWYFQILVLVAGLLENPELALNSLSICTTVNGFAFMISVGFNAAASVRVGNELGHKHPKSAAFSVVVVMVISTTISIMVACTVLAFRNVISYVFTEGATVAAAVSDLCPFLAITLVLNGIQPVLSGVAVGCGWQSFVACVNVCCYYLVGLPLGVLLGFYFKLGAKGIWLGMLSGTAIQTCILSWVTFRTDWNKEVDEAVKRLNKWNDTDDKTVKNIKIEALK